ncbi:hypothetical protein B0H11DRAFT_1924681 [Mycena galericulata]|nr:hypothetical protein B0H11DRAFT_1924681 [Mycena galericulata]
MHWNYNLVRSVRVIQVELRVLAVTSILEPNSCWKTLTPAVREAHMLEGLFRTCLREPVHMPNTRMYTSDITLASMETDNGEGFLTLLKKYVPDEASVMSGGSTSYLHPGWTKESIERLENAGHAAGVQIWIALRDSFLVSFLYNTISSVVGIPRVIKSDDNESTPLHWGTRICEGCGDREGNGARFSVCKNCNENVSRKVFYCSRTCQNSDWPNHKKVCGKELTPGVVQNATCSTDVGKTLFRLERIASAWWLETGSNWFKNRFQAPVGTGFKPPSRLNPFQPKQCFSDRGTLHRGVLLDADGAGVPCRQPWLPGTNGALRQYWEQFPSFRTHLVGSWTSSSRNMVRPAFRWPWRPCRLGSRWTTYP